MQGSFHHEVRSCAESKISRRDEDVEVCGCYCEVVARFYERGMRFMHMENVGGGPRRYCQDIDVVCSDAKPEYEEVMQDGFLSLGMPILAEIFPTTEIRACKYSSSGHSKKSNCYKTSIHIVHNVITGSFNAYCNGIIYA